MSEAIRVRRLLAVGGVLLSTLGTAQTSATTDSGGVRRLIAGGAYG